MKLSFAKAFIQCLLLILAVCVKIAGVAFFANHEYWEWLIFNNLLFDLIYYGNLMIFMSMTGERRWLLNLCGISLLASVIRDTLGLISDNYFSLPVDVFYKTQFALEILILAFGISLFFSRPGLFRPYFRWMGMLTMLIFFLPFVSRFIPLRAFIIVAVGSFATRNGVLLFGVIMAFRSRDAGIFE